MDDQWGISDPDFLRVYVIGLATSLLFAYAVRILTRAGAANQDRPRTADELTGDEVAYLAGGPRRVVETAVARLVAQGDLRPSGEGYVRLASRTTGYDPVTRTVVADVNRFGRRSVRMLVERLHTADAVAEVRTRLVGAGLVVDERTARTRVVVGLAPTVVLIAVGLLRWLDDVQLARPMGLLTLLLVFSGAIVQLLRHQSVFPRTFLGDRLLAEARSGRRADAAGAGLPGQVSVLVAVGGLGAYPDLAVRTALVPPTNPSRARFAGGGEAAGGVVADSKSSGRLDASRDGNDG